MSQLPPKVAPLPVWAVLGGRRCRPTSCYRSIFRLSVIVYTRVLLVDFGGFIYLRCLLVFVRDCFAMVTVLGVRVCTTGFFFHTAVVPVWYVCRSRDFSPVCIVYFPVCGDLVWAYSPPCCCWVGTFGINYCATGTSLLSCSWFLHLPPSRRHLITCSL